MSNSKYISMFLAVALIAGSVLAFSVGSVNAQSDSNNKGKDKSSATYGNSLGNKMRGQRPAEMMKPGVFGTVSAINGNTITVSGRQGRSTTTPAVSYTVDATNAKITKNNVAGSISSIMVGDTVAVQGKVTGTNVVATVIRDGVMRGQGWGVGKPGSSTTPIMSGNGQPIVAGTVSAISGSTLTITNKSNVTYTVDITNAKILQGPNTVSASNIKVGDTVVSQGMINGNSVVASTLIDQTRLAGSNSSSTESAGRLGFLGGIGQFFMHLFGF